MSSLSSQYLLFDIRLAFFAIAKLEGLRSAITVSFLAISRGVFLPSIGRMCEVFLTQGTPSSLFAVDIAAAYGTACKCWDSATVLSITLGFRGDDLSYSIYTYPSSGASLVV